MFRTSLVVDPTSRLTGCEFEPLVYEQEDVFMRMCAWDDKNYIMGAGTRAGSDRNKTDGIVDGHAYSVLTCLNDVAGTDVDLIKLRNPHGRGEITEGEWDDDGPGWSKYPQVKAELNPVKADDGVFWVSKSEFFKYFGTIYLCAKDMSEFLEDAPADAGGAGDGGGANANGAGTVPGFSIGGSRSS